MLGWRLSGFEGVVAGGLGVVGAELELFHGLVADFDAGGVVGGDQVGVDLESGFGGCGAGVVEDGVVVVEGSAGPVLAELGEDPVFDGYLHRSR